MNSRMADFLAALESAEPDALCSPPGFGILHVRHVRAGLESGVLTVHHSGEVLAYTNYTAKHGACQHCAAHKGTRCTHCGCVHCKFDRLLDGQGSRPPTALQLARVKAQVMAFQFGKAAAVVRLEEE